MKSTDQRPEFFAKCCMSAYWLSKWSLGNRLKQVLLYSMRNWDKNIHRRFPTFLATAAAFSKIVRTTIAHIKMYLAAQNYWTN